MRNRPNRRQFAGLLLAGLLTASLAAMPLAAQQTPATGVYTLDQERLFNQSAFGARVLKEIERRSGELAAENHRIEEQLKAEEQSLTERRPNLPPADFRVLADQFDTRVENIRAEQAQKSVDLNAWADDERKRFFTAVYPVLLTMADELGAAVVLDQRSVIITSAAADLTDEALKRVDAELGDGVAASEQ